MASFSSYTNSSIDSTESSVGVGVISIETLPGLSLYFSLDDAVPLYTVKPSGQVMYKTWLDGSAIDAVATYHEKGANSHSKTVYLGSSFTASLLGNCEEYILSVIQEELRSLTYITMVVNVGAHWNLLVLTAYGAVLLDPMAASRLPLQVIRFAARVYDAEDELLRCLSSNPADAEKVMAMDKLVSVRSELDSWGLSFFNLNNVGVQLREEEGYNCGFYCALWVRQLTHVCGSSGDGSSDSDSASPVVRRRTRSSARTRAASASLRPTPDPPTIDSLNKYTQTELKSLRQQWQDYLDQAYPDSFGPPSSSNNDSLCGELQQLYI